MNKLTENKLQQLIKEALEEMVTDAEGMYSHGYVLVDDADMAVFNPIYCSSLAAPESYRVGNGDLLEFSWTSAFWIHNWVANMAYHKYSYMIQDIRKVL